MRTSQPTPGGSCVKVYFAFILLIWIVAAYFAWQTLAFLRGSVRTEGTVTDFSTWNSAPNKWHNTPTFSFTDQSGKVVTVQSKNDISQSEAPVGSRVPVVYQPAQPENAEIPFVWPLWNKTIILFLMGFLFAVPGIIVWLGQKEIINLKK